MSQRGHRGGARIGTWKYVVDGEEERRFDLVLDPGERRTLADQHPEILQELRSGYAAWTAEMLPALAPSAPGEPR